MKIRVKQVLQKSASFYKENFKKIAGVSLLIFVFIVVMECYEQIMTMLQYNPVLYLLFSLVALAVMIAAIVVTPKLYLAMMIMINSLLDKKEVIFKEAYRQTKGKYWTYIWYLFIVILCTIPFGLIISVSATYSGVFISLYATFIMSFFYTFTPMLAIEPKTNGYLKKSRQMIKGNYGAAFILTLITTALIGAVNLTLATLFQGKPAALLIIGLLYSIAYFFVYPFASTAAVIVYRELKIDDNNEPDSNWETL